MKRSLLFLNICSASLVLASGTGNPGGTGGVTPAGSAEIRTLSETVPAGATAQVKMLFTQPRPITSTGASFDMSGCNIDGIAFFSPLGDTVGTAVFRSGKLYVSAFSPSSDFGTNLDYPFLMITMDVPVSTPKGSAFPLALSDGILVTPNGPLTLVDPKPGVLTVGGSISVRGVFPGGGTYPAGTVISVRGTGFQPGTKLSTKMKTSSATYISPSEIRFSLQQTTTMDTQPLLVQNPDGSQVTFYSYLKGAPVGSPSRVLLQRTEPIFQLSTHGVATVGPFPAMANGQFVGVAVQNPTPGPVVVTFRLEATGATNTVQLPAGARVMDDLATLLGVPSLGAGDVVSVTSTSGVQILGLYGDENLGTVTPFVPAF